MSKFSQKQLDGLFADILIHDDFYPYATLPEVIYLNYSQKQIEQCFQICLQLWKKGIVLDDFKAIVKKYQKMESLTALEQRQFKHIRAKFKHLRFAFATFTKQHQYPGKFHVFIALLGYLQDVAKNNDRRKIKLTSTVILFLLQKSIYHTITKELDCPEISSRESLQSYIIEKISFLKLNLIQSKVTAKTFHKMRIVISQLVAMYNNLQTLYPSQYHDQITEFLSTLNGLMGNLHDELVAKKFSGELDYYKDLFKIPRETSEMLTILIDKFLLSAQEVNTLTVNTEINPEFLDKTA